MPAARRGIRAAAVRIWLLTDRRYLRQRMPRALLDWLEAQGYSTHLVVADEDDILSELPSPAGPSPLSPWRGLEARDLVVARSRHPFALSLLGEAEALGAATCESLAAILKVRDKVRCTLALARKGLPVPPTFLARRPEELRRVPTGLFPLLLKPVLGDSARGLRVVWSPGGLHAVAWEDSMVLAQPYVDAGGVDLKLYVAGEAVWAIRRGSPLVEEAEPPVPAPVTPVLRDLVRACREEFRLLLFGVDLLESRDGLLIVDVNEFPNYTGVEEAPAVIGRLLLQRAIARAPSRASEAAVVSLPAGLLGGTSFAG